jgi:Flp pilus assembly protein CpaB
VAVLVAARDLPSGTVLARDDVVRRDYPADLAPDAAATSPVGRVLAAPLARGAVVTDVGVVGPGLARAEPGRVVLPVRLPDAGMTALLRAGDLVDLMATDPGTGVTTTVASGVTVLATPRGVPEGPAGGAGGALVVVAATPADAVEITGAALSQYLTIALDR